MRCERAVAGRGEALHGLSHRISHRAALPLIAGKDPACWILKDHARRLERGLAIESNESLEPCPDKLPGARAGRPAGDGLVEERFSETLRPKDRRSRRLRRARKSRA